MGCGMSTEDKEGKARNEEIENQLKRDKMMQRNEIKMLLLGMSSFMAIQGYTLGRFTNSDQQKKARENQESRQS